MPERSQVSAGTYGRAPCRDRLDERAILSAYRRWAPVYDRVFGQATSAGQRAAAERINAALPEGGVVLEAGVGTGLSLGLYDRRLEVIGIDLSPEMLARARERVQREGLTNVARLEVMDASSLALPDASVDAVSAMYMITVVPDPEAVMAEFERVLKPGGRLVILSRFRSRGGIIALGEAAMSRFSSKLGWRPGLPIERVLSRPGLETLENTRVGLFRLFSLIVMQKPAARDCD